MVQHPSSSTKPTRGAGGACAAARGVVWGAPGVCGVPELCMAHHLSQLIEQLLDRESNLLRTLPEPAAAVRPGGESTWSPKEELGHLIDSAANNHIRFVCASIEPEFRGPSYAQNDWVLAHGYQEMPWHDIIILWMQFNALLIRVLDGIPAEKLPTLCFVGSNEAVSLQHLAEDYVIHMQHHVDHLLGRERVTPYP